MLFKDRWFGLFSASVDRFLCFTGNGHGQAPAMIYPNDNDGIPKVSLPVFGLASYKLKGSIWAQNCVKEHQMANSLMQAAEKWLRRLQVNQPDFQFFASNMTYWR